ncbi:MAG: hypothetical protein ACT4PI_16080, partial [Actinomycetota bacterium]
GGRVLDIFLWTIAVIVSLPGWLLAFAIIRSTRRARRQPLGEVPDELAEPPSDHDPALVAVLVGEGRPSHRAVAGTVLALADRGVVDIEEYGDRQRAGAARPRRIARERRAERRRRRPADLEAPSVVVARLRP